MPDDDRQSNGPPSPPPGGPGRYGQLLFPPYAYTPGEGPHPITSPDGHMHGQPEARPLPLDPPRFERHVEYLHGVDLYNHGYYWEAHEAWEGIWHALGREGLVAEYVQFLIQLTAAHVKIRQRNARGMKILSAKAIEGLRHVADLVGGDPFCGVDIEDLILRATDYFQEDDGWPNEGKGFPFVVLDV